MEQTKIEMMMEEEMKPIKEMCEKVTKHLEAHLAKGLDAANTEEVGLVVDMIKDLCEAKEKIAKCFYYKAVTLAMDEYEEDNDRMYYRGRSSTTGRYMHRGYEEHFMPEHMRDMDRAEHGRMYYTNAGSSSGSNAGTGSNSSSNAGHSSSSMGYSEGYSDGQTRGYTRGYEDGRRYHTDSKPSTQIENSISELSDDIMELKSREEKEMAKQKLQRLLAQIN